MNCSTKVDTALYVQYGVLLGWLQTMNALSKLAQCVSMSYPPHAAAWRQVLSSLSTSEVRRWPGRRGEGWRGELNEVVYITYSFMGLMNWPHQHTSRYDVLHTVRVATEAGHVHRQHSTRTTPAEQPTLITHNIITHNIITISHYSCMYMVPLFSSLVPSWPRPHLSTSGGLG